MARHAGLSTIPTDLLLSIAEHITTERDFDALTRVNRGLYDLLNHRLYRNHVRHHSNIGLLWAAEHGQLRAVQMFISHGADPHKPNNNGETPFIVAAKSGHTAILQDLLHHKVDAAATDSHNQTALSHASSNGHANTVKFLLTLGFMDPSHADRNRETPFILAAKSGHLPILQELLHREVDPSATDRDNRTALLHAARNGHAAVVTFLLTLQNVDPNHEAANSETPLRAAASRGDKSMVNLLLATGKISLEQEFDLHPRSAMYQATAENHPAILKILIRRGADPAYADERGYTMLHYAAMKGSEAVLTYLLSLGVHPDPISEGSDTPLTEAVRCRQSKIVKILLRTGKVNPNIVGFQRTTPLSTAACMGLVDIVQCLLDTERVRLNSKDAQGQTPLYRAATAGHVRVVKLLLAQGGIAADQPDYKGRTPLMGAIHGCHIDVVKLFLDRDDVDINAVDNHGQTPLFIAASKNKEGIVEVLIEQGVRIDCPDYHGRTPFDWATWLRNEDMEAMLNEYAKQCGYMRPTSVRDRVNLIEARLVVAPMLVQLRARVAPV